MAQLKRFLIERDIPGMGGMSLVELCGAARTSNRAIEKLAGSIHWEHSYVTDDKSFCLYLATSEDELRKHAELSGFPVTRIVEVRQIIDPTTANH
jgi:hypothetical protein